MPRLAKQFTTLMALVLALPLLLAACGNSGDATDDAGDAGGQPAVTISSTDTPTPAMTEASPTSDPGSVPEPTAPTEPTPQAEAEPADLAPQLGTIDSWHNAEPLTLAELHGSPVLLVFWADF